MVMSAHAMTEQVVYTVNEVAEILRIHPQTVRRMIADKELPAFKIRGEYRIRKSTLEEVMRERNWQDGKE